MNLFGEIDIKKFIIFWLIPLIFVSLWYLREILFIVFISAVFGLAIQQWGIYIKQRFKIPFYLSIPLIYLFFSLIFVISLYLLAPIIILEIKNILPNIQDYIENLGLKWLSDYFKAFSKTPTPEFVFNTTKSVLNFIGGLFNIILVLVLSFYIATQPNFIPDFFRFFSKEKEDLYLKLFNKIKKKLSSWLAAQIFLMFSIGLSSYLLIFFLRLPYAGLIGLIAGITEIIPIIGPIIGATVAIILTLSHDPNKILWVLIGFIIIQQLENNILVPLVAKTALKIKPVITLISILIGAKIGGVLGILAILPMMVILYEFYEEFYKIK